MAALLRCLKRRTSLEFDCPHKLARVEFYQRNGDPDLALSAYDIEPEQYLRARTEHSASFLRGPPSGTRDVDLAAIVADRLVIPSPGATHFRFTKQAHRELLIESADGLVELARRVLYAANDAGGSAVYVTRGSCMKEYAKARLQDQDSEWIEWQRLHNTRQWL